MTIAFVTFIDQQIAINPDQVVYVRAGLGPDSKKCWVHFTGNNQPIRLDVPFSDVLNALEYTEEMEAS